ncbi:MAG TPA: FYDLN acid domain-containing protein [Thermoanaerobaculia bacterium]|nr:FYDLN acid domain-containing protein [Thermoanaerobaculia bacterium]
MANLGRKYTCYSCHTKFYDLGKPVPLCPRCNADQRNAEEAPVITSHRSRRIVEAPVEEPEFASESENDSESEETEEVVVDAEKEEPADDDEEDEF